MSEYVLHGWTPVLRTHGVLVMARNDLVASRPMPALTTPPQTTDLYFSGPSCEWGATPNYLPVPDSSRAITLPVRSTMLRTVVHYSGWAVDPATNLPASTVLIADGDRVVGKVKPTINAPGRGPVPAPAQVGERLRTSRRHVRCRAGPRGGLFRRRGRAGSSAPAGRQPGPLPRCACRTGARSGSRRPRAACGWEVHDADVYTVGELRLPSGIDLRDYDLATLSSTGGLGGANVALTDQFLHEISASWLDQAGSSLTLRVGSCPQWYGYDPSQAAVRNAKRRSAGDLGNPVLGLAKLGRGKPEL